jgi:hypothetical protein
MSLDKIGQLFNLPVSKLCFPYNQATSIKTLKTITSLKVHDENFWKDTFTNKIISLDDRLEAQVIFNQHKFKNLYQYGDYYLRQDCLLLHSIVITLFENYLKDNINLVLRRNFSQSSLSYQQFFIIEPSKQIKQINAPKKINNPFYNYFIKQAVTGGFCTSFVQGTVDKNIIINDHLNYVDFKNIDKNIWPSFNISETCKKNFNENPAGINTIDIRSLYPSAALKKIPVGTPLFYSRFVPNDFKHVGNDKLSTYHVESFCKQVQEFGDHSQDYFKLLNKPPQNRTEYTVLQLYLQSLSPNIKILRFQSSFTALGQMYINEYPVDGFLSYYDLEKNTIEIKVIQYNSVYYHGHINECKTLNNPKEEIKAKETAVIKTSILNILESFKQHFKLHNVNIEYVDISDCQYFLHQIPKKSDQLFYFKNNYNYKDFLEQIYNKKITGFLVVKNLEIKKNAQNPTLGFIIQKVQYELKNLSPFTQNQLKQFSNNQRVIDLHKCKSFMVISTEYFTWLDKTFGFEKTPDIYHALLFQTEYYLRDAIESKLVLRKKLKELIKCETNTELRQNFEITSELIKLMLNSCYGFTLCNVDSLKFKQFTVRTRIPRHIKRRSNIQSCIEINENTFLVEQKKKIEHPFQSLLGHVGCYILFNSKIILLKRIYFLLKYLNPTKAQLLYMDTDSAHFLVKHKNFKDNVDSNLQFTFSYLFDKHFETGCKISGIWVQEGFFEYGEYIGEKCYKLCNESDEIYVTHMKGLNKFFQNKYLNESIDIKKTPCISFQTFVKSPDFTILKCVMSKALFNNYVPIKRYFIDSLGSLPLKLS